MEPAPESWQLAPQGVERPEWWPRACARAVAHMEMDGAHDEGHIARVLRNAARLFEGEREAHSLHAQAWAVVGAAVLFHDVVNLPKDHPERAQAATRSAAIARAELAAFGLSTEALERVEEAIRGHSYSAGAQIRSIEAQLVRDADRLDAIGAIGLARMFLVGGQLHRPIMHPSDPLATDRPLDDLAYSLDHLPRKLLRLADAMCTPTGRALAQQRHAYMQGFLAQLMCEIS